uniref:Putative secreted protein n=1 Tax=Anopheles darlingi TaxID=43151 RepID=A0A2M4D4F9_ANODA
MVLPPPFVAVAPPTALLVALSPASEPLAPAAAEADSIPFFSVWRNLSYLSSMASLSSSSSSTSATPRNKSPSSSLSTTCQISSSAWDVLAAVSLTAPPVLPAFLPPSAVPVVP